MSGTTKIEWTGKTWNPVTGCTKVSAGCDHCYAETFAERFRGVPGHPYEQGFDVKLWPDRLDHPLRWRKPTIVFVNSMSDLFHDAVPDDFIAQVFGVMAFSPQHTFQVLTKRPGRMASLISREEFRVAAAGACVAAADRRGSATAGIRTWPLPNVWLGVSVEDQKAANMRIPKLLETPAAIRFLSCEPLLGPVSLGFAGAIELHRSLIDWVIVGGESGPGARRMDLAWARSLVDQCRGASVPVFVKQLGSKPTTDHRTRPAGEPSTVTLLRDRKGGDMSEWPKDLRVREMPETAR